jgi:hypothetical protein
MDMGLEDLPRMIGPEMVQEFKWKECHLQDPEARPKDHLDLARHMKVHPVVAHHMEARKGVITIKRYI